MITSYIASCFGRRNLYRKSNVAGTRLWMTVMSLCVMICRETVLVQHLQTSLYCINYPPFEEGEAYCFAHVSLLVCWYPSKLVQPVIEEHITLLTLEFRIDTPIKFTSNYRWSYCLASHYVKVIFSSPEHKCLENYCDSHAPSIVVMVVDVVVCRQKLQPYFSLTNWHLLFKFGCRLQTVLS